MRTAWRITTNPDPARAFSGAGAREAGGRWNSKGTAVVYLADWPAAAILEMLVRVLQTGRLQAIPQYFLYAVTFEEADAELLDPATLPSTWRTSSRDPVIQVFGDTWAASRRTLLLQVPSAVAPHHLNYLLNPAHPRAKSLTITPPEPFTLDPRLTPQRPARA